MVQLAGRPGRSGAGDGEPCPADDPRLGRRVVDPPVRKGLRPGRLVAGAMVGAVVAVLAISLAGESAAVVVIIVGSALTVLFLVAWIASVLYLRTERGRAAREERLERRGTPSR